MDLEAKINLIQTATSQEEAFTRYNNILEAYGYNRNVYSLVNDHPSLDLKAQHGFIGSYPLDWLAYYHEQSYFAVDPIMYGAAKSSAPFYWDEMIQKFHQDSNFSDQDKQRSKLMINQAQDAGVADGLCISFVSPLGEISGFGLARERPEKKRNYNEMAEIYLLSSYFHEKFRSLLERNDAPQLSPREREILLWAAEGKSDGDIANILGISTPTVRYHWKNMFEKLGVNSRWLAIIKSIRLQIISPHLVRPPYQR